MTATRQANPTYHGGDLRHDLLDQDDPELAAARDATFELLAGAVRGIQAKG